MCIALAWDTMIYEQSKEQEQDQKDQDDAQTRDKNTRKVTSLCDKKLCGPRSKQRMAKE